MMGKTTRRTHSQFLQELLIKNEKYNYVILGQYINSHTKILVHTKYGNCLIEPNSLLRGINPSINSAIDKSQFCINQFKDVHGDIYEYPNLIYSGNKNKIEVLCNKHGIFEITPKEHVKGSKCKKCYLEINNFKLSDWEKINPKNNGILYVIECYSSSEKFIKIGITIRTVKERYKTKTSMPYNYNVVYEFNYPNRSIIWNLEKYLKNNFINYRPQIKFKGSMSECFSIDKKENILQIIKSQENYEIENWINYESND